MRWIHLGGARAQFAFEAGGERERWFYTPTDHGGLRLSAMSSIQQREAHRLLASGLSRGGYVTTATIMGLDNILDVEEGFSWPLVDGERPRDPMAYAVSIFGEPGSERLWGWRFGGHHVSLHYLVTSDEVRALPSFFGANPARTEGIGGVELRPLAAEEDLGRALVHRLDAAQRARAVISSVAPPDMVTFNRPMLLGDDEPLPPVNIWRTESINPNRAARPSPAARLGWTEEHAARTSYSVAPKGLALAAMDAGQRAAARALLRQYIDRMPEEIAQAERARLDAVADGLHFAWAGGLDRGEPYYYRLQGEGLLIEHDNTQNEANHIHSVWRDPRRDFGRDLLAAHYAQAHAHV